MSKLKYYDGTTWNEVGTTIATLSPTGSIVQFAGSTAPTGWLLCEGQAVSRTTYADLFAIIGTTYGTGNGSTTFNLPNLKGRVPVGYDSTQTEFDTMGETGGEKAVTLGLQHLPNHTHTVRVNWENTTGSGVQTTYASSGANLRIDAGSKTGGIDRTSQVTEAHNNLQPYIVLKYIIKI